MFLGGEDRLNAQAGDLANVEVLDVLRDLREMRGRGFSMTGLTAEQRLRLLEVSRFESRVMAYIEGTAPLELQTNLDAARRYTSALTARGMTPLEAAQLTNYQPIAEVDLHTVCRCHFVLFMRHVLEIHTHMLHTPQIVPNFAERFSREESFEIIEELGRIVAEAKAENDAREEEALTRMQGDAEGH